MSALDACLGSVMGDQWAATLPMREQKEGAMVPVTRNQTEDGTHAAGRDRAWFISEHCAFFEATDKGCDDGYSSWHLLTASNDQWTCDCSLYKERAARLRKPWCSHTILAAGLAARRFAAAPTHRPPSGVLTA